MESHGEGVLPRGLPTVDPSCPTPSDFGSAWPSVVGACLFHQELTMCHVSHCRPSRPVIALTSPWRSRQPRRWPLAEATSQAYPSTPASAIDMQDQPTRIPTGDTRPPARHPRRFRQQRDRERWLEISYGMGHLQPCSDAVLRGNFGGAKGTHDAAAQRQ